MPQATDFRNYKNGYNSDNCIDVVLHISVKVVAQPRTLQVLLIAQHLQTLKVSTVILLAKYFMNRRVEFNQTPKK